MASAGTGQKVQPGQLQSLLRSLGTEAKRHLNNEPVVARPPSAAYRFQKAFRRNKLAFAAVTSVVAVLVLGVVVSTWQAIRAMRAEREQSRQRDTAVKASASEAVQRKLADTQRDVAEAQRNVAVEQRKLADMQLALQAWEEGDLQRANDLIDSSRPAPGQAPGFEWRYLRKLCQDQSIKTFGTNHQYRSAQFFDRDLLLLNDEKTLTLQDLSSRKKPVFTVRSALLPPPICSAAFQSFGTSSRAVLTNLGASGHICLHNAVPCASSILFAGSTVPSDAIVDVRVTVTVRVVPMAQSKVTELERVFTPMHEQLGAGLRPPDV
jgi:hypothetical protein